jgi:hypothetical protein
MNYRNLAAAFALGALVVAAPLTAARASDEGKPGGPGDYLVHVGKWPVWASQVKQQRTDVKPAAPRVAAKPRLTPVTVGKRTLVAVDGVVRDPFCPVHAPVLAKAKADTSRDACEIEGGVCTATLTGRAASEKSRTEKSRGYFRQRGKATEWVPADR